MVARSCLRDPGLGRSPRSVPPLTDLFEMVMEGSTGGLRGTVDTLGDGDGVLLADSGRLPPFWPELFGGCPPPRLLLIPPPRPPPRPPLPRPLPRPLIPRKADPGSAVLRLLQSLVRGEPWFDGLGLLGTVREAGIAIYPPVHGTMDVLPEVGGNC